MDDDSEQANHDSLVDDNDKEEKDANHTDDTPIRIKAYKIRWYLIILFACFPFMNALVVATWGPISRSAHAAFGFTAADVALVSNMGLIGYIPSFPVYAWIIKSRGIRAAMLMGASLLLIGGSMRMLVGIHTKLQWTIYVGQLISSFAIPLALVVPPAIISTWVPDNQRVTITALLMLMASFGGAVNGIMGPQLVRQLPVNWSPENTTIRLGDVCNPDNPDSPNSTYCRRFDNVTDNALTPDDIRRDILILLGIQNVIIAICTILVFIYFPSKPRHPPSLSASKSRTGMLEGLKQLGKNRPYWLITVASCLPNASYTVMIVMLEPVLGTLGYSQKTVGWLIFAALSLAIFTSVSLGRLMDKLKVYSKLMIVTLAALFSVFALWQGLQCNNIISNNLASVYCNIILNSIISAVIFPLTCDVTCEMAYPVSEGLAMGIFQLFQIIMLSVLLGAVMIPGFNVQWIMWLIFIFVTTSVPMFAACKMELKKFKLDMEHAESAKKMLPTDDNGATTNV
ncbi:solute carrier family 49 member 4 homolog [Tubulanus polymorphus]|uniref:solute carrier family 49 member 4 homolog n=1 Tax=Tubulanus polymorphus TaxID=672921 RepID=UPI003DA689B0